VSLCKQGPKRIDGFLKRVLKPLTDDTPLVECARIVALVGLILRDLEAWNYEFKGLKYRANLDRCLTIFDSDQSCGIPFDTRLEVAEAPI
jgi:hypothetical protein